jgi:hypothetical protein
MGRDSGSAWFASERKNQPMPLFLNFETLLTPVAIISTWTLGLRLLPIDYRYFYKMDGIFPELYMQHNHGFGSTALQSLDVTNPSSDSLSKLYCRQLNPAVCG